MKIVLNHFGGPLGVGPYKRDEVFPRWRADIKELSACPNVFVKLGGLAMIVNAFDFHLAPLPPSSGEMAAAWRPYVETCIENFGPTAACSKATYRLTREPAAIQSCSTPSSGWRMAPRQPKRLISLPVPPHGFTAWALISAQTPTRRASP